MAAREFAFRILSRWTVLHDPPHLPERADPLWAAVPPRQRAFAFDLITGILRWRNALDAVIASRLKQPIESLELPVRAILWLGTYQLLIQEKTQNYAAVDTAVSLARKKSPRAAGLVNAVLRGVTRLLPRRTPVNAAVSPLERLSRRALALDFATELRFNADVFPDPATGLTGHLAAVRSHPALLTHHFQRLFGDALASELLLRSNQRPVITLRVDADQIDLPASAGLVAHGQAPQFLVAADGWNDTLETLVNKGTLSPQDPTSAQPVRRLQALLAEGGLPPPRRILDLCAGLGTKTLQLARAFPQAAVFATDIDSVKLQRLAARGKQVGQKNISVLSIDSVNTAKASSRFDIVLADVPCSNTGVLARRIQSRWRWPTLDAAALASLQSQLLAQAAAALAPSGVLVYSTCSVDASENQDRVDGFLAQDKSLQRMEERFTLPSLALPPSSSHDGGYFAILHRA